MLPLLTIDTLTSLFYATVLHPFPAFLTTLSLVALGHPLHSINFQISAAYFVLVTVIYLLKHLDARIASGTPRKLTWSDEVVVITGGAGGLGSLIAALYGMRGANVAILDVKPLSEETQAEHKSLGVKYYNCDVGDREQVQRTAETIEEDLGPATILINNAAVVAGKQILDLTTDDITRSNRVNILSHYHTIQTFLPGMLQRPHGGTIVTVSSVLGHLGCAGLSDYTAGKAAQTALHASLRAELRMLARHPPPNTHPAAIRTVLVEPGQLTTSLFARVETPSTFLAPKVEALDLARRIVQLVDRGVDAELREPFYTRWIGVLDILPAGARDLVRRWSGLDEAAWAGCR